MRIFILHAFNVLNSYLIKIMTNIAEKILLDAKAYRPQYAERMTVIGPQTEGMPLGLIFYGVRIAKLHDYTPINYIVLGEEFFCSLKKGDFVNLLKNLQLLEDNQISATDLTTLFLLLEFPTRYYFLVDKLEDITIPENAPQEMQMMLTQLIAPPKMQLVKGVLECVFLAFNVQTKALERFFISILPDYTFNGTSKEVINFRDLEEV